MTNALAARFGARMRKTGDGDSSSPPRSHHDADGGGARGGGAGSYLRHQNLDRGVQDEAFGSRYGGGQPAARGAAQPARRRGGDDDRGPISPKQKYLSQQQQQQQQQQSSSSSQYSQRVPPEETEGYARQYASSREGRRPRDSLDEHLNREGGGWSPPPPPPAGGDDDLDLDDDDFKDVDEDLARPWPEERQGRRRQGPPAPERRRQEPRTRKSALPRRYVAPAETGARPGASEAPLRGEAANEKLIKKPKDQLFYSKKARPVNFKPYTLEQYREVKPEQYYELGKLQPDLNRTDLVAKRQNADRIKEFSKNLREVNTNIARHVAAAKKHQPAVWLDDARQRAEEKPVSKREKANAFAKNIRRPRPPAKPQACADPPPPSHAPPTDDDGAEDWSAEAPSRLDELEAKHDHLRSLADEIRRQYNF